MSEGMIVMDCNWSQKGLRKMTRSWRKDVSRGIEIKKVALLSFMLPLQGHELLRGNREERLRRFKIRRELKIKKLFLNGQSLHLLDMLILRETRPWMTKIQQDSISSISLWQLTTLRQIRIQTRHLVLLVPPQALQS